MDNKEEQPYVGSYISNMLTAVYSYLSSTAGNSMETTNELICYGTQTKRSFYPFNVESIKNTFCTFGNANENTDLKIWNIVRDTDGVMECHIEPWNCAATSRSLWEQSALELKTRDKEFIPKCLEALDKCNSDEIKRFLTGIKLLEKIYKNEKKYRHSMFFNDIYGECLNQKIKRVR